MLTTKQMTRIGGVTILGLAVSVCLLSAVFARAREAFEAYYLHLTDYPSDRSPSWARDPVRCHYHCLDFLVAPCSCQGNPVGGCFDEVACNRPTQTTHKCVPESCGEGTQGITHDDNNWFITTQASLWKIPVGDDLDQDFSTDTSAPHVDLVDLSTIASEGYDHFGDLDHYQYLGKDYLLVPLQRDAAPRAAIAVFRAEDLTLIDFARLPAHEQLEQDGAGWCAVDPKGYLYSSDNNTDDYSTDRILRYHINWDLLNNSGQLSLTFMDSFPMRDEDGNPLTLYHMQGGEFTPSGELLYLTSGILACLGGGDRKPTDGMHVIDVGTWQRVQRSTNGTGYFDYAFDNGCGGLNEPEGLTIWDLDNGRAPGVSGQLHVIKFNHESGFFSFSEDQVTLKHYSGKLYVNNTVPLSSEQKGTAEFPFHSVTGAYSFYPVWDGAKIIIVASSYPEAITLSKRIKLEAQGGPATIGR